MEAEAKRCWDEKAAVVTQYNEVVDKNNGLLDTLVEVQRNKKVLEEQHAKKTSELFSLVQSEHKRASEATDRLNNSD